MDTKSIYYYKCWDVYKYIGEQYQLSNGIEGSESEHASVEETGESPQDSLKAGSSRESIDKLGYMKSDSYISGCTNNSSGSKSTEDILRNLVETEQLYKTCRNDDADSTNGIRGTSHSSVDATALGLATRHLSDLTLLDPNVIRLNAEGNNSLSQDDEIHERNCERIRWQ